LFWPSLISRHRKPFLAFTEVLEKIRQGADFTDQVRRQTQKETKTAKILADCLEFFTEGNEGKEGGLHSKERKFKLRFPRGLL